MNESPAALGGQAVAEPQAQTAQQAEGEEQRLTTVIRPDSLRHPARTMRRAEPRLSMSEQRNLVKAYSQRGDSVCYF